MTRTSTYLLLLLMLSAAMLQPMALPTIAQSLTIGTIQGVVYDRITGEPIANARVELRLSNESWTWFNDTWTNADGEYSFEVPSGTYHIVADKWPNYTVPQVEKFVEVEAGSTVSVDLFLWPTGRVNGTVAYEGVTSEQGADVLFVNATSGNVVARKYAGVWDGGYILDVPVGDYDILAFGWGYGPGRMTDEVSPISVLKGEETPVDIDLRDSGMEVWVHTHGWRWEYMPGASMTCIVEVQNTTTWEPISNASIVLYFFGPVDWPHSEPFTYSASFDDLVEVEPGKYIARLEVPSDLSPGQYNIFAAVREGGRLGLGEMWLSIIQYRLEWCHAKSVYSPSEELSFRFTVDDGSEYITDLEISYAIVEQFNGTEWVHNVLETGKATYNEELKEYEVTAEGVTVVEGHKYRLSLSVGQNTYDWWFEAGDTPVILKALSEYPVHIELGIRDYPPFVFTCDRKVVIIDEEAYYTKMRLPIADVDWIHLYYDNVSTPAMDIFESWEMGPNATALIDLNNTFVSFTAVPAGEIRGVIRDDETGEPLGDVEVLGIPIKYGEAARWAYARSDWDGSYRLPVVAGRAYLLRFSSTLYEVYKTDNETHGYRVMEPGAVATVDVNLTKVPTGVLTGVVFWDVDVDGVYNSSIDKPLSDVWIGFHDFSWNWLGGVTTAANGRYTFTVRADTFLRITTWLNETFRSRPIEGVSVAEGETLRLDIPLERAIIIRGRIEGPGWVDCLLLDGDYNIVDRIGEGGGWDFQWSVPASVETLLFRTWGDYYPTEVSLPKVKTEEEYDIGSSR
ncbi:carboxypeptidase regulatory-like domain-containing protein [Candidatus Bathyarchaeota archaeon]|nr:carboxypeptidase regulatory-like domain-containing protein [Candidatus Bathyarchaeota archaeon]